MIWVALSSIKLITLCIHPVTCTLVVQLCGTCTHVVHNEPLEAIMRGGGGPHLGNMLRTISTIWGLLICPSGKSILKLFPHRGVVRIKYFKGKSFNNSMYIGVFNLITDLIIFTIIIIIIILLDQWQACCCSSNLLVGYNHRRRINTEEKAKVVAAAWGT